MYVYIYNYNDSVTARRPKQICLLLNWAHRQAPQGVTSCDIYLYHLNAARHWTCDIDLTSLAWKAKKNTMHPWNHPIIQWSWNPWHPWHPRMPLIQLFRGTTWLLLFGPCLGVGVRRILKIKAMSDRYWIGGMRKAKLQLSPNKGEV